MMEGALEAGGGGAPLRSLEEGRQEPAEKGDEERPAHRSRARCRAELSPGRPHPWPAGLSAAGPGARGTPRRFPRTPLSREGWAPSPRLPTTTHGFSFRAWPVSGQHSAAPPPAAQALVPGGQRAAPRPGGRSAPRRPPKLFRAAAPAAVSALRSGPELPDRPPASRAFAASRAGRLTPTPRFPLRPRTWRGVPSGAERRSRPEAQPGSRKRGLDPGSDLETPAPPPPPGGTSRTAGGPALGDPQPVGRGLGRRAQLPLAEGTSVTSALNQHQTAARALRRPGRPQEAEPTRGIGRTAGTLDLGIARPQHREQWRLPQGGGDLASGDVPLRSVQRRRAQGCLLAGEAGGRRESANEASRVGRVPSAGPAERKGVAPAAIQL
ncbi:translation initiation factor IF-2-like [Phocoena sinus]|uniref:translation initiation factor IF-2-like n=1 Tax=Phocoena sinus TaxID=42100 RepID=UPI0013C42D2C|nr:translation initiation factor IF-2-like [Phocoena sinus]